MNPDTLVTLAFATLDNSASDKILSLYSEKSDNPHLKRKENTSAVLDALAGVCTQEKGSMVAIGLKIGKPIELILATDEEYPRKTIIKHLIKVCSFMKKISDLKFYSRLSKADEQSVSPRADFKNLLDPYDELFLEVYKYSYHKLNFKHTKWWTVFEEFRAQSLDWVQRMKQEGGESENVVELVDPYQSVFSDLVQFRTNFIALRSSLVKCCQTEKVGSKQMQLLRTRWHRIILCARAILDDSSACEYWATKVAMDGPPVQLRRAIEKLVTFHRHISTLIQFASSPRMRPTFFSTEITVTSVEKKRPDLLEWPSKQSEWIKLLSAVYMKQDLEREPGRKARSSEQKAIKRATEYGRPATIHGECAVVAYLHQRGSSPAFSYIGVSKHSCKPSHNWIKAYNQVAGTNFRTKGTNNKWYKGWARPGLGKAEFQKKVDARFLELVEKELCMRQIDLRMARKKSLPLKAPVQASD